MRGMGKRFLMLFIALVIIFTAAPAVITTADASIRSLDRVCRHDKKQSKDKRLGLYRKHGNYYYAHKTSSPRYKKGDLSRECFRIINGKWYYFRKSGKMQKRDSHYIDIRHRDYSVRYIYTPGTNRQQRYSTKLNRYQVKVGRHWMEVGMQCYYGPLDDQP